MAPYILPGHDKHGMATTKREDFLVIVIVQKHVKNHVRLTGANQRFIRRIGNALDAIELVVLQARRVGVFLAAYRMSQKPCDRNLLLQKPADRRWIFCLRINVLNCRDQTRKQYRGRDAQKEDLKRGRRLDCQKTSKSKRHHDDPKRNRYEQPVLNRTPSRN